MKKSSKKGGFHGTIRNEDVAFLYQQFDQKESFKKIDEIETEDY